MLAIGSGASPDGGNAAVTLDLSHLAKDVREQAFESSAVSSPARPGNPLDHSRTRTASSRWAWMAFSLPHLQSNTVPFALRR